MRNLIDTIFSPVLNWLHSISSAISQMAVPLARPLDISKYFGYFGMLGSGWQDFIKTVCALAFIYCICYLVVTQVDLFRKFKDAVKWW